MPILINEVHTEVIEAEADAEFPQDQPGIASIPAEFLKMHCLMKERQARLEDD